MKKQGILYLVATPIGNLKDITFRALKVLKAVDEIICETTNQAKKLLSHYQIKKPLLHLSDENQLEKIPRILEKLNQGKKLALISDAGTPIVSDPGFLLVKQAIKRKIKITPLPGPSAILTALITAGLPPSPFLFIGFLPKKESQLRKLINELKVLKVNKNAPTIIAFESPHRLLKTIEIIKQAVDDNCQIVIGREMTKIYEEFQRGKPSEIIKILKKKQTIKGEISLVIHFKDGL